MTAEPELFAFVIALTIAVAWSIIDNTKPKNESEE